MCASRGVEQQPEFTETFDVTKEAGSYNTFIEGLRQRVQDRGANGSPRYRGNVLMLKPEQDGRDKWFDVVLISGDSHITVRLRYGDLYLAAFQGANDQWYEFQPQNNNPPLFSGTVVLPYTHDYWTNDDLTEGPTLAHSTMVGANSLASAISSLASPNFDPTTLNNRQLLINLFIMLPAAIRFMTISDFVYARMKYPDTPDSPIITIIDHLVHSLFVLMRPSNVFTIRELAELGISIAPDASRLLGLLLCSSKTPSLVTPKGRQLVEIFSVQILDIVKEFPVNLYGNIRVDDGLSCPQYIFNRPLQNRVSIRPQEYVLLTGPTTAISAFDSFYIDVSLRSYDSNHPDIVVSRGQITWNYFSDNVYNQPLREEVDGSIAVSYAVYSNAVTATVEVTLINGGNENHTNVYGTINALTTLFNEPINLFNRDQNNCVDIKPLELIPLLRSVVVVPLTYSIKVDANLSDNSIEQGLVTFRAATSGSNTDTIKGKYGEVEVKVTWSSSWD